MRVILDVDEVLTDFVDAACRVHGTRRAWLNAVREPGKWGMYEAMGMSEEKFWKHINERGIAFWEELEPLPWMDEVLELVARVSTEFFLVTAPSSPASHQGKLNWIKNAMGEGFSNFIITSSKHLFAQPGVVIIDDREETVHRFIAHGGSGIVFPAHHNSKHEHKDDPVAFLREELGSYL
jgi:5'(3')-deoxyribonucleotidase|tara:strand:- start:5430 stop:5969 length:540 start_codon:yes stop_codon:yes gene_type:complete